MRVKYLQDQAWSLFLWGWVSFGWVGESKTNLFTIMSNTKRQTPFDLNTALYRVSKDGFSDPAQWIQWQLKQTFDWIQGKRTYFLSSNIFWQAWQGWSHLKDDIEGGVGCPTSKRAQSGKSESLDISIYELVGMEQNPSFEGDSKKVKQTAHVFLGQQLLRVSNTSVGPCTKLLGVSLMSIYGKHCTSGSDIRCGWRRALRKQSADPTPLTRSLPATWSSSSPSLSLSQSSSTYRS